MTIQSSEPKEHEFRICPAAGLLRPFINEYRTIGNKEYLFCVISPESNPSINIAYVLNTTDDTFVYDQDFQDDKDFDKARNWLEAEYTRMSEERSQI